MAGEAAEAFFLQVRKQADAGRLLSREHFSLDDTLVEGFRPKEEVGEVHRDQGPNLGSPDEDGGSAPPAPQKAGCDRNPSVDFHEEKRTDKIHASRTDPEALLARRSAGEAARLVYAGHLLTENRNGLIVWAALSRAPAPPSGIWAPSW